MYFDYSVKKDRGFYFFALPVIRALSKMLYDIEYEGEENIPDESGFILASNHISSVDPGLIIAKFPYTVHFMAKSELFEKPFMALLVRNLNAFPVHRETNDRKALKYAVDIINNGGVLGIFPEGRRVRNSAPTQGKGGVSLIARMTRANVLPVCIYLENKKRFRPKVRVIFGKMIKNNELNFNSTYTNSAKIIMDRISELWEAKDGNKGS